MSPVKVERVDREAAWVLRPEAYDNDKDAWHAGYYDNNRFIQAFARHRIAEQDRIAGLLEAQQEHWRGQVGTGDAMHGNYCWGRWTALSDAVSEIRIDKARCARCGVLSPKAFARNCNWEDCEYRK